MAIVMVECIVRTPEREDVAAGTDKPVGLCRECRGWLYLQSDGKLPRHERAVLVEA